MSDFFGSLRVWWSEYYLKNRHEGFGSVRLDSGIFLKFMALNLN